MKKLVKIVKVWACVPIVIAAGLWTPVSVAFKTIEAAIDETFKIADCEMMKKLTNNL